MLDIHRIKHLYLKKKTLFLFRFSHLEHLQTKISFSVKANPKRVYACQEKYMDKMEFDVSEQNIDTLLVANILHFQRLSLCRPKTVVIQNGFYGSVTVL